MKGPNAMWELGVIRFITNPMAATIPAQKKEMKTATSHKSGQYQPIDSPKGNANFTSPIPKEPRLSKNRIK